MSPAAPDATPLREVPAVSAEDGPESAFVPAYRMFRVVRPIREPEMFLPAQYFWLEPVIIAAVVVFVVDLVGNTISFSNRFLNALVTAVVFGAVFGALVYFGYGNITMSVSSTPSASAPAKR
jgi:hypothetical protein